MAIPGSIDVEIGAITTKFQRGLTDATRDFSRFTGNIKTGLQSALPVMDKTEKGIRGVGDAAKQVTVDTKAMTLSMVGLGTTMIGLATATSRLGQAENRLEKSKVAVRRINDQIASTQKNLNRLIEQGKTNTEDYAVQLGRLETAYVDLETKQTVSSMILTFFSLQP
jgi:hypothetical protein